MNDIHWHKYANHDINPSISLYIEISREIWNNLVKYRDTLIYFNNYNDFIRYFIVECRFIYDLFQ